MSQALEKTPPRLGEVSLGGFRLTPSDPDERDLTEDVPDDLVWDDDEDEESDR